MPTSCSIPLASAAEVSAAEARAIFEMAPMSSSAFESECSTARGSSRASGSIPGCGRAALPPGALRLDERGVPVAVLRRDRFLAEVEVLAFFRDVFLFDRVVFPAALADAFFEVAFLADAFFEVAFPADAFFEVTFPADAFFEVAFPADAFFQVTFPADAFFEVAFLAEAFLPPRVTLAEAVFPRAFTRLTLLAAIPRPSAAP